MAWEYKVVGAPEKGTRKRGAKTGSDRVAAAMEPVLAEHAADGWEYVRADLVPVTEKPGMFAKPVTVHRAVLVFRREKAVKRAPTVKADEPLTLGPADRKPEAKLEPEAKREPRPEPRPEGRQDARADARPEPEIRLAHSSDGTDLRRNLTD